MNKILLSALLVCLVVRAQSQVFVGKPAPEIVVDTWVNNPNTLFTEFKNKVVVLDFWFTKCAPCLYTMPHLNDLAERYKNDNIVFVAITFEEAGMVEKFLVRKTMYAMVGTDTSEQLINKFEVSAYPRTYLIDENGILLWQGYPTHLTENMLEVVLAKDSYPGLIEENILPVSSTDFSNGELKIAVEINNDESAGSGLTANNKEIGFINKPLTEIFAHLLKTSKTRIITTDSNTYDIRFKIPKDLAPEKINPSMIEVLCKQQNLILTKKKEMLRGYTLMVANDSLFQKHAIDTTKSYAGKSTNTYKSYWEGKGLTISDLVMELESRYDVYVFDKTLLNGYFEFVLGNEFDKAAKELFNHYGLALLPEKSEATIYLIEKSR